MATNGEGVDSQVKSAEQSILQSGFKISSLHLPILKAGPIEEMTKNLGITPPEMIFGDNYVRIEHVSSGWGIEFNAYDALDRVDKTGEKMLKVSYSKEWQDNRQHVHSDIKEVIKPFDWSYTTDYKGTLLPRSSSTEAEPRIPPFTPTTEPLPVHLLTRPDPIIFYNSIDLFEDELADNGMSVLTTKVRVMPQRLLVLSRFFMRLDDVLFRIRDTRVYIEFGTGEVVREYTAREEKYDVVKRKLGRGGDVAGLMREPDKLMGVCPVVETVREKLVLPR